MKKRSLIEEIQKSKLVKIPNFKEKKTRLFSTIVFSLLGILFFAIFAIRPTLSTIGNLRQQLDDAEFVNTQLEQKLNNLTVLEQRYTEIETDIPLVLASVPESPSVPSLLAQIQAVGREENVEIRRLQAFQVELSEAERDEGEAPSFAFSLEVAGGYDEIISFTSSLLSIERVITYDNLSISGGVDKSEGLRANIRGRAYFKD